MQGPVHISVQDTGAWLSMLSCMPHNASETMYFVQDTGA